MKWLFACCSLLISSLSIAQVSLGYYDLPSRGHTYYQKNISPISGSSIPASVYDSTDQEHFWDFTEMDGRILDDTMHYFWVEGTSAAFDFPDANMADIDLNGGNEISYFIKNQTGLYFSGQSGAFGTDLGDFDIKAEFRPAVPILKIPARLGDVVDETSRASVSILTLGKVNLTTFSHYEINGYGTVKIPGGEEFLAMRVKRVNKTVIEFSIELIPGQPISDTTTTTETTYEFYTPGYGDAVAKVTVVFDENLGLDQYSFDYKNRRDVSSIETLQQADEPVVKYLPESKTLQIQSALMEGGVYELVSVKGQSVGVWKNVSAVQQLSTQTLEAGPYVLKSTTAEGLQSSQQIIIH